MERVIVKKFKVDDTSKIEELFNNLLKKGVINNTIYTPVKDGNEVLVTIFYEQSCPIKINNKELLNALSIMYEKNSASMNILQQELGMGFNKTAILIDILEDLGIVSEKKNNEPRKLLICYDDAIEIINNR